LWKTCFFPYQFSSSSINLIFISWFYVWKSKEKENRRDIEFSEKLLIFIPKVRLRAHRHSIGTYNTLMNDTFYYIQHNVCMMYIVCINHIRNIVLHYYTLMIHENFSEWNFKLLIPIHYLWGKIRAQAEENGKSDIYRTRSFVDNDRVIYVNLRLVLCIKLIN